MNGDEDMKYNWEALTNEDISGLIRNGGIVAGYDADFNRALVEETAIRIERAAQLEAELSAARNAAGIDANMPLDEWITAQRNDHADMTRKRDELKNLVDEIRKATFMPDGSRLSDAVNSVMRRRDEAIHERNEARRELADAQSDLRKVYAALAQNVANRRELIDTVAALKRENEALVTALSNIKLTLAVGRNVGNDKAQAYCDSEAIADKAIIATALKESSKRVVVEDTP